MSILAHISPARPRPAFTPTLFGVGVLDAEHRFADELAAAVFGDRPLVQALKAVSAAYLAIGTPLANLLANATTELAEAARFCECSDPDDLLGRMEVLEASHRRKLMDEAEDRALAMADGHYGRYAGEPLVD